MNTTAGHQAAAVPLGHYDIDPAASGITIRTRHLFGLGPVRATLAVLAGTISITEPLEASAVEAAADAASFRSSNPQRDQAVLSARFLDPARHPVMKFTADRVDLGQRELAGTLTVRGVSRPVTFSVGELAATQGSFTTRATARIDRTQFGITAARGLAARYLDVTAEVTCVRS
jgi:polyisoprenoid-binding protein YceI